MAYTSASSPTPTRWDVFLSFRGIDTRNSFTDHLYSALNRNGIRTFMDDPELRSGDVISDALLQAIQESKTYVVVLSENYASSGWCLDELVEIFSCYESMGRLVVPVFYNIQPAAVRRQTGSFNEALQKHETRFGMNRLHKWRLTLTNLCRLVVPVSYSIEPSAVRSQTDMDRLRKWRVTLTSVANFSGHEVSKNTSQADIVNKVVERVLHEINPKTLDVAKHPVGLNSRVEDITSLLSSDTEGVIRIGIHGMGGIGKTTLAKEVYNQYYRRFQGSCFLANVREASETDKGLASLQQQLINDVLKRKDINVNSVDHGIELIRARISSAKVLIVIDDLDAPRPLKYLEGPFASGSIILITTRNEDLLDSIKVKDRYEVNKLGDAESRQLFRQHAFEDNNNTSDTLTELSEEILKRAGGLPLALEVFGSNLINQSEERWRWFIDKLKRVSIDDIDKKLLISFDALELVDRVLQNIYLDIACFHMGRKKEEVVKIMETCYAFVNCNIDILKKRCLLTINKSDELGMHDLLRDMGRKIARNNSPDEPGKHSRLWDLNDIHHVMMNHKGTEAIEGIIPIDFTNRLRVLKSYSGDGPFYRVSFATKTFKRMSKLRFLYLQGVNLTGSFEQTLEDLRWLCWDWCPLKCLPSQFYPQKLVTLELRRGKLRSLWELNMVSPVFENLKTLDMAHSLYLITTPDFTKIPCLETLNLEGCKKLKEVHISIGSCDRLVSLCLNKCVILKSLPDTICNLRSLKVLSISYCRGLQALPTKLGNIESLQSLHANYLTVSKMPNSIGRLTKLVTLNFGFSQKLESLPDTICNLRALEILRLEGCSNLLSVPELPPSLKTLYAFDCTSMERLPNLSNLKHLEDLNFQNCSRVTEIRGLEKLISIRELQLGSAYTFTKRLFQIYSGFGHQIIIRITPPTQFPDWVTQSRVFLDLPPNASHNFLATILYFKHCNNEDFFIHYSLKNTTSDFIWSGSIFIIDSDESLIVIVPGSEFPVRDGDKRIELTADADILGIGLVYKTEIDEVNSNTVEERSY